MSIMIPCGTSLPAQHVEIFSTAVDGQTNVEIKVLKGNHQSSDKNKTLGVFRLDGILPAPKGIPQIYLTFDIDTNGNLNVSAKVQISDSKSKSKPRDSEADLSISSKIASIGGRNRIRLEDGRSLEVNLPVGLVTGHRIRLKGQGIGGGDLYLKITVTE